MDGEFHVHFNVLITRVRAGVWDILIIGQSWSNTVDDDGASSMDLTSKFPRLMGLYSFFPSKFVETFGQEARVTAARKLKLL